jgi:4-amino-4-deoxy-L-arabinose transferase-like glycosyltransferase
MAEREWRETSDMRTSVAGVAIVLAVAAVLRFWALGSGIPFAVGTDEPQIMNRVVQMMKAGSLNPNGFFDYPTLYLYVQLVVACVQFVLRASSGVWGSLNQVTADDFYLWARVVTALLGTATVYLVYLIGCRWGARHALLAAGLMAVMPNHVRESHYVLTDVPMAFLTTLAFLLTLRALEKPTLGAFAWAGATAGFAAATKYYGGVMIVAPLLAAGLATGGARPRHQYILAALAAAIAAFLLAAPYTVLDLPGFLNGFGSLSTSLHGRDPNATPGSILYLKHLRGALWMPGMLLLLWGLIHAVVRAVIGPGRPRFILLVVFPIVYFALVSDRTLIFARYLMPLFPFACLLIAIAIVSGVTLLRRFNIPRHVRAGLIVALTVVAILPPAASSLSWDVEHARPSTFDRAYQWIVQNVPVDAGIIIETENLRLPARFRSMHVKRLVDREYGAYVAAKMQYAVLSAPQTNEMFALSPQDPARYPAYRQMLERMSLVAAFKQSSDNFGPDVRIFKLNDDRQDRGALAVEPAGRPGK